MALQYGLALRNARLDATESTIGTAPKLLLYTGDPPANCAAAATGTLLCTITLPSDWLAVAADGQKTKLGTWTGTVTATGLAGYFRLLNSGETVCHMQGTVTETGGGGDMTINNPSLVVDQTVTGNSFTLTAANA